MTDPGADILAEVRRQFRSALPARLGVAVSGGGDSIALLHLLKQCFQEEGVELFAATVDHGLRPESAHEAAEVAQMVANLGIPHEVLRWQGWQGKGNLQDQARQARYRLLADWAKRHQVPVVALGHTADDQAETVLMRLSRAAGVTGLAAMPVRRTVQGITLLRPLLAVTRAQLRSYLRQGGITWIDDPSNDDSRFERVRIRQAMALLAPLGLTVSALATVAENMGRAREAIDWYTFLAARDLAQIDAGAVVLDQSMLRLLPDEIIHRLLVRALQWVSGRSYPPRRRIMTDALVAAKSGGSLTLGGCRILCQAGRIWICREYNAVRDAQAQAGSLWDNRWRLYGGDIQGLTLRALAQNGLLLCPDWRQTGRPSAVLEATPALWNGTELVAAPLAGMGNGWVTELAASDEDFYASVLSH